MNEFGMYPSNSDAARRWADAEIVGVYIGIESIGRTWAYLQVRNLRTVTVGD